MGRKDFKLWVGVCTIGCCEGISKELEKNGGPLLDINPLDVRRKRKICSGNRIGRSEVLTAKDQRRVSSQGGNFKTGTE